MNQLATLMPALEQSLAGLPQGAAAARGAPPDQGGFALALGEQLWTLPATEQAGGADSLSAEPANTQADIIHVDPAALLQDLLAVITRMAVDSAGGEQMLAGRIVSALREFLSAQSTDSQLPEVEMASADQSGSSTQQVIPVPLFQQFKTTADSSPVQPESGILREADESQPVDRPGKAVEQISIEPRQLAPLVIKVLEQVLAELQAQQPAAQLSARIEVDDGQNQHVADADSALQASKSTGMQLLTSASESSQIPIVNFDRVDETGGELASKPDSLLQIKQPGLPHSASVEWFNALGSKPSTAPAPAEIPAGLSIPDNAVQVQRPIQTAQAPPVQLVDRELALPGAAPLHLKVQTLRGSALDPEQHFDVIVSDPAGEAENLIVSMELRSLRPERLITAGEMQRVAATLQRVLDGPVQQQTPVMDGQQLPPLRSTARLTHAPDRSVALMEQTDTRGNSVPEVDGEAPTAQSIMRGTPVVSDNETVADVLHEQRIGSMPETDTGSAEQNQLTAAQLSSLLGRRRPEQTAPSMADLTVSGGVTQHPGDPQTSEQAALTQSLNSLAGQQMLHPQTVTALPDHLLRFSAPVSGNISGYAMDEIQQQLMERVRDLRNAGDGLYNIKLDLYPKELGRMIVNIAIRGSNVAMQMAVVNQDPSAELKKSLAELKKSLEEEGLSVVDLRVITLGNKEGRDSGSGNKSTSEGSGN